jgi:hypothetical protein
MNQGNQTGDLGTDVSDSPGAHPLNIQQLSASARLGAIPDIPVLLEHCPWLPSPPPSSLKA